LGRDDEWEEEGGYCHSGGSGVVDAVPLFLRNKDASDEHDVEEFVV